MGNKEEIETLDLGISNKKIDDTTENIETETKENVENTNENIETEAENKNVKLVINNNNSDENIFGDDFATSDNLVDESENQGKKKYNLLKNIIVIIVLVLIVVICFGIYSWMKGNEEKLENAIKDPALDYFDKYMSVSTGAAAYKVNLEMLKQANENGENYYLDALKKCDDKKTEVIINIDYSNGKVTGTEIKLSCKKF